MDSNYIKLVDGIMLEFEALKLNEYDSQYFPAPCEVEKITQNKWRSLSAESIPSWIGFGENKCYELRHADELKISVHCPGSITQVFKVINPYLERAYNLKKMQKSREGLILERTVYHATTPANVDSININNFNWRLFGQSRGNKHGKGVSFSPYPSFANRFCKSIFDKRLIVVNVVYQKSHVGFDYHVLPISGYDTTVSRNGNVLVKFEDSEFLPLYVIHYK